MTKYLHFKNTKTKTLNKFNNLPSEIIFKIYSYDNTYYEIFKKVIKELKQIKKVKNNKILNLYNLKYFMTPYYNYLEENYSNYSHINNIINYRLIFITNNDIQNYNNNLLNFILYHIVCDIPYIIDY